MGQEDCKHERRTSTLMWPPEANSIRCEDCGAVLREAYSNVRPGPSLSVFCERKASRTCVCTEVCWYNRESAVAPGIRDIRDALMVLINRAHMHEQGIRPLTDSEAVLMIDVAEWWEKNRDE